MENYRKYLDPRTLAKLQCLELRARSIVEGYVTGAHRSPYHGFSVEFAEHREYVPGDDLRYVDWKAFGKTDRIYLKQYEEETNLVCYLLLDVSESMTQAMPQLKNSVKRFLAALGPKDQVTLTAFNDNLFTLTRRETSTEHRLRAVDRLAPWGGTALYDVIVRGLQQLSKQPGRRVLVVFSDGDDRTSHATLQSVEQAVRASDATLFMVASNGL